MTTDDLFVIPTPVSRHLVELARDAIRAALEKRPAARPTLVDAALERRCGAFVSLKKRGMLRGCIGRIESEQPLWETVTEMARAAAFDDPRFPAVGDEELKDVTIEISVMSPVRAVESPDDVVAGAHGVTLELDGHRAVFLPQVAAEQRWDRITLLEQLCLKAGLPADAWRDSRARIEVFSAQVIDE